MSSVNKDGASLKKGQVWGAACSLLVVTIVWFAVRLEFVKAFDVDLANIDTVGEVVHLHNRITNRRSNLLTAASFLWLTLPLVLLHIYYVQKVFNALFINIQFLRFVYVYSWFIQLIVVCIVVSPSMIMAAYYSWEFNNGGTSVKTGYYIQLLCVHYAYILGSAVYLSQMCCACIPWIILIGISWKRTGVEYSDEFKSLVLPRKCATSTICCVIMVLFVLLVVWAALGGLFNFAESGFYAEFGGSAEVAASMILISYVFISFWLLYLANKVPQLMASNQQYESLGPIN